MSNTKTIKVIGGGLAGSEAAWQLAEAIRIYKLPYHVELYEMRPQVKTPAHHTDRLAELVCSNSLGSEYLTTARGLLINEMQHFNSLIISAALRAKVPAGQALAVDREIFGNEVTSRIEKHSHITLIREEFREKLTDYLNKDDYIVIATGPLTSEFLAKEIQELLKLVRHPEARSAEGSNAKVIADSLDPSPSAQDDRVKKSQDDSAFLHFFDAASPILEADSINMDIAFKASRYGKQEEGSQGDYINCPFYSEEEFDKFYEALISAERAPQKDFEKESFRYFEGCMPIEAIAERGKKTLCFGPMKPVGLRDPRNPDKKPVAVVQLRQDNVVGSLYNIVGFQTNLKWGEQKRVFSMIPGLENLEIVRYGVMHQNIFINSPVFLNADMSLRCHPEPCHDEALAKSGSEGSNAQVHASNKSRIYFAGQITGVEGYTESAASGIIAARSIVSSLQAKLRRSFSEGEDNHFPKETMMGALANYISTCDPKRFQPINSNWGLLNTEPEKLEKKYRKDKKLRYEYLAKRALALHRC